MWPGSLHSLIMVGLFSFAAVDTQHPPELTKADIPPGLSRKLTRLIEATFSVEASERALAAKAIGERGQTAAPAVPFLIRLLGDVDSNYPGSVRDNAADALVAIGEPAIDACIATANMPVSTWHDDAIFPRGRRHEAIACLGKFKAPKARNALVRLMKDDDSNVRAGVVLALQRDVETPSPHIKALDDPNSDVRRFAAEHFQSVRDAQAVVPLLKLLESNNIGQEMYGVQMRRAAITALGFQQDRRAVPALMQIMKNRQKDAYERADAAVALGTIGDKSVFPPLAEVFWDRNAPVPARRGAVQAIAMFRDEKAVGAMLGNLFGDDGTPFELQIAVVQAMAEYGDPQVVEPLLRIVDKHGRNTLAFCAAMSAVKLSDGAIGDIGAVRVIQEHKEYFDGDEMYVKEKRDALESIAEHGTNIRVRLAVRGLDWLLVVIPAVIGVGTIGVTIAWLLRRVRHQGQLLTNKNERHCPVE